MPDVQRLPGLWPDEQELYELLFTYPDRPIHRKRKAAYENFSACRALLEKHEWHFNVSNGPLECLECGALYYVEQNVTSLQFDNRPGEYDVITTYPPVEVEGKQHKPDCAIAAQLAGVRGG